MEDELPLEMNLNLIEEGLFLGNVSAALNIPTLSAYRISHILTVDSKPLTQDILCLRGMQYYYIQVHDMAHEDLLSYFEDCFKFIEDGRTKGNVLVHCYFGVSRSAAIVASYLMKKYEISMDSALEMIKKRRSCVGPNSGFLSQLLLYQKMNYCINSQNEDYKYYLNSAAARFILKSGFTGLRERFPNFIYPDPIDLIQNDDYIKYKCKLCRRSLVTNKPICSHQDLNNSECSKAIFTCPISWMSPLFETIEGKIHCPKCKAKIGSFDWKNFKTCPCGKNVAAACMIVPSKVDKVT